MDYEKEQARIRSLLESFPSEPDIMTENDDEEAEDQEDPIETDVLDERQDDSDSEQSLVFETGNATHYDDPDIDIGTAGNDQLTNTSIDNSSSTQLNLQSLQDDNNSDQNNVQISKHHAQLGTIREDSDNFVQTKHTGKRKQTDRYLTVTKRTKKVVTGYEMPSIFEGGNMVYVGKDGTKWNATAPANNTRTRQKNIVTTLPKVKNHLQNVTEPLEIWKNFFTDQMMDLVVTHTNQEIERVKCHYLRASYARLTNKDEISALIGVLLLSGVQKSSKLNAAELFSSKGTSPEIFLLAMSEQRFRFLIRFLNFDDKTTRQDRRLTDKLAPIRELFDIFVENCKKHFTMSQFVTVDEMLVGFRGRCSFRQYIPSKPAKYGIKIYGLCDAKLFYTTNMEVYVGKQPPGPYEHLKTDGLSIVDRLCQTISGTSRNVTTDNWFSSIPLCEKLINEHRLTMIGTLRKNKPQLPKIFIEGKGRESPSSVFAFRKDCTVVSHIPKPKKNVIVISSMHDDDQIDEKTNKPEIILDYNRTKGGVDVVDKLCASYTCARATRRWPMVIFYTCLNIAGVNSQIIFSFNSPDTKVLRRKFLTNLAYDLMKNHLVTRYSVPQVKRLTKLRIAEICGIEAQNDNEPQNIGTGRCKICSSKANRKTKYYCRECKTFLCLEHAQIVCKNC